MLEEEIVIEQLDPAEYIRAHFKGEPNPVGFGSTPGEALLNLLRFDAQERLQVRLRVTVPMIAGEPQRREPEENRDTLFHPTVLSGAFIAVFTALLGILAADNRPFFWWQMPIAMIGLSTFWDFGWHAWQHHLGFWPAHWLYRATGAVLGLAALLPSLV